MKDQTRFVLLMAWIRFSIRPDIPRELLVNDNIAEEFRDQDTFLKETIRKNGTSGFEHSKQLFILKYWLYHNCLLVENCRYEFDRELTQDDMGLNPLLQWLKYRTNQDIPEELLFKGWQRKPYQIGCDRYKVLPLHFWIKYRPGKPIPKEFLFKNCEKYDKNIYGEIPLHYWIEYRSGEPIPKELFYEGCQKVGLKYTPLMYWIKHRLGPVFHLYEKDFQDEKNFQKMEPIPDELMYNDHPMYALTFGQLLRKKTRTPLSVWAYTHPEKPIPKKLLYPECGKDVIHDWLYNYLWKIRQSKERIDFQAWLEQFQIPEELKFPGWNSSKSQCGDSLFQTWLHVFPQIHPPNEFIYEGCQDEYEPLCKLPLNQWFQSIKFNEVEKFISPDKKLIIPEYLIPKKPMTDKVCQTSFAYWANNEKIHEHGCQCPEMFLRDAILHGEFEYNPHNKCMQQHLKLFPDENVFRKTYVMNAWCSSVLNAANPLPENLKAYLQRKMQ